MRSHGELDHNQPADIQRSRPIEPGEHGRGFDRTRDPQAEVRPAR
jgi:hypothetical protein